jgi:SNF2 family DNA or RNA helicase
MKKNSMILLSAAVAADALIYCCHQYKSPLSLHGKTPSTLVVRGKHNNKSRLRLGQGSRAAQSFSSGKGSTFSGSVFRSTREQDYDVPTPQHFHNQEEDVKRQYNRRPVRLPSLPAELDYDTSCFGIDAVSEKEQEFTNVLIKNAMVDAELKNGWTILDYQKRAVLTALKLRRMILAYDMGLGKTLIACIWAQAFVKTFGDDDIKVIVIAPKTLHSTWTKTAQDCTDLLDKNVGESDDDVRIHDNSGSIKKTKGDKMKAKTTTTTKGAQKKKGRASKKKKDSKQHQFLFELYSWGKVPPVPLKKEVKQYIVICDEAHYMQSMEAQRTKGAMKLLESPRCIGCLLLTGTPMKNGKPKNIYPLLRGVRHPMTMMQETAADNQMEFEQYFCNGQYKIINWAQKWDANGAKHLSALRAHIAPVMMYLSKEEALQDLPGIAKRGHRTVPMTLELEADYKKAVKYLVKKLITSDSTEVLAASQKVRRIAADAKVAGTVDLAKNLLEEKGEPAVVIFTNFVEVARKVHDQLEACGFGVALLTGDVPAAKRQTLVDEFQSGARQVFVATYGTGGVGLTLTASRVVILLDRPWTPGDVAQAEDRVHRIGQTQPVVYVWMRCCEWDIQIDHILEAKQQQSNAVIVSSNKNRFVNRSTSSPLSVEVERNNRSISPARNNKSMSIYDVIRAVASKLDDSP